MIFSVPKKNYTELEKNNIYEKYKEYESELKDSKKIENFIESRTRFNKQYKSMESKCFIIMDISSYFLIQAILGLTILKDYEWYIPITLVITFVVPMIHNSIFEFVYNILFASRQREEEQEKENLRKLYDKMIYEKYEQYIKKYEYISNIEEKTQATRNYFRNTIRSRLLNIDYQQFRDIILMLYSEKYKLKECKYNNCLVGKDNDGKIMIMYKKINRSISISDIERFNSYLDESNIDTGLLFYIGDISTKAVRYCSQKLKNKIFLYNIYDLCDEIFEYKLNEKK